MQTQTIPRTVKSTRKVALLRRHADGRIQALSSDGHTVYTVTLAPENCTCRGWQQYNRCYHVSSAERRFGKRARPNESSVFVADLGTASGWLAAWPTPTIAAVPGQLSDRELTWIARWHASRPSGPDAA